MAKKELASENDFKVYATSFINNIKSILRPGMGADVTFYLSKIDGSIIYFKLRPGDLIYNYNVLEDRGISEALKEIPQRAFRGNLSGIKFGGTNTIIEGDKIIFIKGGNTKDLWTHQMAEADSKKFIESIRKK